jgi:hypothetical protein
MAGNPSDSCLSSTFFWALNSVMHILVYNTKIESSCHAQHHSSCWSAGTCMSPKIHEQCASLNGQHIEPRSLDLFPLMQLPLQAGHAMDRLGLRSAPVVVKLTLIPRPPDSGCPQCTPSTLGRTARASSAGRRKKQHTCQPLLALTIHLVQALFRLQQALWRKQLRLACANDAV